MPGSNKYILGLLSFTFKAREIFKVGPPVKAIVLTKETASLIHPPSRST